MVGVGDFHGNSTTPQFSKSGEDEGIVNKERKHGGLQRRQLRGGLSEELEAEGGLGRGFSARPGEQAAGRGHLCPQMAPLSLRGDDTTRPDEGGGGK